MPPATTHRPTAPLAMIMIAAKIVSRGSAAASAPPASIIERISATSITVTASARMSVPNGSPTRCATTSAWWTAATTAAISAGAASQTSNAPSGSRNAAATTATAASGATTLQRSPTRSVQRRGERQPEFGDRCLERMRILGHAEVGAAHRPVRRRDLGPARVLERLPRLEHRLVADDGEAAHLVDVAGGIGDDPVARDQLGGDLAAVGDRDRVRERVVALVALRLLGQVAHCDAGRELGSGHARF